MKYCGKIGYVETVETEPGIWEPSVTERYYKGDVIRYGRRWETRQESPNGNININNQISIVSDSYAANHLRFMRYAEFMGCLWTITNVDVDYPRLTLTLGGVYNSGDETGSS